MAQRMTTQIKANIRQLHAEGKTAKVIAKVVGYSYATVSGYVREVKRNPKRYFSEEFLENRKRNTEINNQFIKKSKIQLRYDWKGNPLFE